MLKVALGLQETIINNKTALIMNWRILIVIFFGTFIGVGCGPRPKPVMVQTIGDRSDWKRILAEQLPLLGHRNWILVVDKAFPLQTSSGMTYVDSGSDLPTVLSHVLTSVNGSSHARPIVYRDAEMALLDEQLVPGVDRFKARIDSILGNLPVQQLPHEAVFRKMDETTKLFQVLVIKTEGTIPYSSVFIELDCAYWNADHEKLLRIKEQNGNEN